MRPAGVRGIQEREADAPSNVNVTGASAPARWKEMELEVRELQPFALRTKYLTSGGDWPRFPSNTGICFKIF